MEEAFMWVKPHEFYDLTFKEYRLLQKAQMNKRQTDEGILRRAAFLVGQAAWLGPGIQKAKVFEESFNEWWPYGDKVVHEKIDERITRLRKQAKEEVEFLNKHAARIQEVVAAKRKAQSIGN